MSNMTKKGLDPESVEKLLAALPKIGEAFQMMVEACSAARDAINQFMVAANKVTIVKRAEAIEQSSGTHECEGCVEYGSDPHTYR